MVPPKAPPSLMDLYQRAGEASLKFLPLLLFEVVLAILRYGALIVCLGIPFGFFVLKYATLLLNDPKTFDWGPLTNDWVTRFTDWGWVVAFVVLLLLYLTWWCLLSAISDAGIFGAFVRYFRDGEALSMERFLADVKGFFRPMLWLQIYLSLYVILAMIFFFLTFWVILAFWTQMNLSTGEAFLLSCVIGIPVFFLFLVFCFLFGVLYQASVVYVSRGMEAKEAVQMAFHACREKGWRFVVAMGVLLLAYVGLSLGMHLVFGILGLFPFIGILFSGMGFLTSVLVSLLWGIYVPALFALLVEEKES